MDHLHFSFFIVKFTGNIIFPPIVVTNEQAGEHVLFWFYDLPLWILNYRSRSSRDYDYGVVVCKALSK